ncbi:MAG: SusD/RagB family nutrient-binding outer membrane lipoprotein, partial [Chitinophagaceae bacterium]|nr:SusD/RagB family nutrient-binding outer membrane lipoprotein [Chitinophagaceae bacterium]
MKTKNIFNLLLLFSALMFTACDKDFAEVNTDPNRIDRISPGTLLNPIIYEVTSFNTRRADDFTFNLMQVSLPFPSASGGVHRYDIAENAGSSTWTTYYRWLTNVKEMYNAAVELNDPNYKAIALTLNAWIYSNLTDCFGNVPMTEAARGDEGILRPVFDDQKTIYTKIIADLDSANNLFSTTRAMTFGTEILYGNNVMNWKRFCNSLQMRLLLRVSKRTEMNSMTRLRDMINDPTKHPVFTTNDQAAVLKVTGLVPNVSPWGRAIDFTTFRAMGKFFLDQLNNLNDPRRERFSTTARPSTGTGNLGYMGIPSGYSGGESQFRYIPSNLNIALVTAPMICVLMPYAEVEFIKSEVELFFNNITASRTAYERGVKASIEQWGAVMPATYFSNTAAAFDGTLERIMLQKYVSLFFVDYQQWFEYRRTGFPKLPTADGMVNNKVVPVRFMYPINVRSTNTANYQKAVEAMRGDN